MDYRDERDALRARVESLEGALATAQAELERMRATEVALDAAKREIYRLRAEVARLGPKQGPPQNRGLGLIIGGGLVVMLIAFGASLALRGRAAAPPPPPQAIVDEPAPIPLPRSPAPPPEPEPVEPAPTPIPPAAVAARSARAEWTATIARSQGAAPQPGTACKILAQLTGDGSAVGVSEVEVICGAKRLYHSKDDFSGMSNSASDAAEQAGKAAGTLRYTLVFQDQGPRVGPRSQISLDTAQRTAAVWSENVPTFRVELRMEPWSLERAGEPLVDPENRKERLSEPIVRTGTVKKVEGAPGVSAGALCTVDVSPASSGQSNCRVRVRCGGALLYGDGQSGYNQCRIQDGRVGRLADEKTSAADGDPALDMDLSENTVIVSDDGDASWKVTIGLAPAAR